MKRVKILFVVFLLMNGLNIGVSQDIQLTDVANLPEARSALTSANNDEHIFVVNGFGVDQQFTSEVFQYDVLQDSWSTLTSSSIPKRFASAEIVGNYLYVFNGQIENGVLNNKVEKIDLNDGSIQMLSDNPLASEGGGVAKWGNKIYTFGGTIGPNETSDKLFEFDPQNDSWTELAEIPFAGETKGEIIDGKLYILGGYNGAVSDRIDIYDISLNSWEPNITMPIGVSAHATAVIGTKIYMVGDYANLNSLAYFDTADNSFHILENNLIERRHCAAEGVGGVLFAIGGNTSSNIASAISSVQKAVITTSIFEISNVPVIDVFPNPTVEVLNLNLKPDELIIYDLKGMEIKRIRNSADINVTDLERGTYFIIGYQKKDVFRAKFIKT